ncbi:DUF2207 domain-containing protein [Microbacterium sp. cx-59]|uniref:DUF2207 domain-containing protein n=1 Tax=Microbacterium sp. cx-59 TaxID=2891207 RepID=UPI001E608D87|nr:DUF2207 domain-containing protein [Microbacterium sp. cx-59]MCC4907652.1 DUF2207 domain-containing protein [Microbacterium sp. cx-59]
MQHTIRGFWALVAVGGLVLLVGPVINPPLTLDDITSSASNATDRWIARDFAVDYTVTRDADGVLRAQVQERITAFFPDDVDEQGIERVLAVEYQGHALDPSDIRATVDGAPVEVGRSATADRLTLSMGTGRRLSGDHEFVLDYTLQDLAYVTTDAATGAPVDLLEWDVFGPSWPQGVASIDVSVTLPDDLDAQLERPPRGAIAWTLMSAGEWLEPEAGSPPGQVTYAFTNDQNLPPHAQARFTLVFAPATFTMPPLTPLFWLQTFGPLLPLALLALTLLLALAARAVAWSDERGRAWYVAQYDPPKGVSARLAAQLLRTPRSAELAGALTAAQQSPSAARPEWLVAAVRAARRTGRVGDAPRALAAYLAMPERREQLRRGLRRIPRGFVRDYFIAAPLALTLAQWGLIRQLSHQTTLAIVWWPVAFVIASSAISAVVLAIALMARPLTREGALVVQHLRGIGLYAERTDLLSRTTARDRLLPYAVLLAPPRAAGRRVTEVLTQAIGDRTAGRGWRAPGFVTWPALAARAFAFFLVAGAIAVVAFVPNPYAGTPDYATHYGDVPGTLATTFESTAVSAELSRTPDGRARIAVSETIQLSFDEESAQVPQFAQQWRDRIDGHDLGLVVERVTVDGEDVPFVTEPDADTTLMRTTMSEVRSGRHEARIDYTLESAAFAADEDGHLVNRVRWAALLEHWPSYGQWNRDAVDPQRVEFRVSSELAAQATASGWITEDTGSADSARDWQEAVVPFGTVAEVVAPIGDRVPDPGTVTTETQRTVAGDDVHTLELRRDDYDSYPFDLTVSDTGVQWDFPAGTFVGPDEQELREVQYLAAAPAAVTGALGAVALILGGIGMLLRRARPEIVQRAGAPRDGVRWLGTGSALATLILFVGVTVGMPGDDPTFAVFAVAAGAALTGGILSWLSTRHRPGKEKAPTITTRPGRDE